MTTQDPFLGTWQLIPEKSKYEHGDPPVQGQYTIETENNDYLIHMQWESFYGAWNETSYTATPDGQDHPYSDPNGPDTVSMTRVDEYTLDSDAKKAGMVIAYARRILSDDLRTMTVIQSGPLPEGGTFKNLSVYKRA